MNSDRLTALKELQDKEKELVKLYSDLIKQISDEKIVKELKKIRGGREEAREAGSRDYGL